MYFKRTADVIFSAYRIKISKSPQFSLKLNLLSMMLTVLTHKGLLIIFIAKFRAKSFM